MTNNTREMATLFRGLHRAYGIYNLVKTKQISHEKILGKPKTVVGEVTETLWSSHLEGSQGLGIVPIMDNSKCYFGAIDIDVYEGLDVKQIISDIDKYALPLVPCRSKSGGLHCFIFLSTPIEAKTLKIKLESFASLLGFGDSEIFPKQTEILADRGDIGQWINMPYFNYTDTERYAYNKYCSKLDIDDFIAEAKSKLFSASDLEVFSIPLVSDISDGPPCLQNLITTGFSPGTRNEGLFNVAVYLKKAYGEEFEDYIDEYNVKYVDPPLPSSEVQQITKSIQRGGFNYKCNAQPLKGKCDMRLCRTRKFGVGEMIGIVQLTGLTKFDSMPPVWFVDIEGGGRLELTTEDMQSQLKFQRKCMEGLNIMPPPVKNTMWQDIIQKLMESVNIIEAPEDASPKGMFFEYLERFCTSRAQAKNKDELLLGKPWSNKNRHHFRLLDFMAYLERHRFKEFKVNKIGSMLTDIGGEHIFYKIKNKGVNAWSIPEFAIQSEGFETPEIKNDEVF